MRTRPGRPPSSSSSGFLLRLNSLSLSVASTTLLEGANATLAEGQRVGLVGPNGCGKSTLLGVLRGGRGAPEHALVTAGRIEGALSPAAASAFTTPPTLLVGQDGLRWSDLLLVPGVEDREEEDADAWRRLSVAAERALGWGLADYPGTPLGRLSPGCALRAYLAVALNRTGVRLLLLDEPTNHLDLPSVLWLEQAILASAKSVICVSHDESFLDAVVDHVWEVDALHGTLIASATKYSPYMHAKKVALRRQREAYEEQQRRNKKLTAVADRLRAASKAGERHTARDPDKLQRDFKRDRAGRSGKKAKAVEKLRDSQEVLQKVEERPPLRIGLDPLGAGTESSIILGSVVLGYSTEEPLPLLEPISLRVDFGERVAIVGHNGAGKTTLLRTMVRDLEPLEGHVVVGRELRIGNLSQEHDLMQRDETPRDFIARVTGLDRFTAGSRVINYGLSRHQVDQPIGEINPGARIRMMLAIFAMRRVNCLVLDEPTNHLDVEAIEETQATLKTFEGTVIVVSHDQSFLRALDPSRVFCMGPAGIHEIESVDSLVTQTEEVLKKAVLK